MAKRIGNNEFFETERGARTAGWRKLTSREREITR